MIDSYYTALASQAQWHPRRIASAPVPGFPQAGISICPKQHNLADRSDTVCSSLDAWACFISHALANMTVPCLFPACRLQLLL